jgi:putative cell wall-binding protein
MKKLIATSVVVGTLAFSLAGCGCSGGNQNVETAVEETAETVAEEEVAVEEELVEETGAEAVEYARLGGKDRYATMAQVVAAGFESSEWAVIVTGENFPDALAASSLAGALKCPIILTASNKLSKDAASELERLGVTNAYIVGGESSVGTKVEDAVTEAGISVTRVFGDDRVETSVEAAKATREADTSSDTVVICTGDTFADSLSVSPWCWKSASPILLASKGILTDYAVSIIKDDSAITRVIIVGGDAAVSDEIEEQLGDAYEYLRLQGDDRYATSVAVADWACENGLSWAMPALATGENFPDALAGSALQGVNAAPILLVSDDSDAAAKAVDVHRSEVTQLSVLGGEASVSEELVDSIAGAKQ